ncbi:MAG: DUF3857 domain-containing protein, partial [Chitinophagaceae bacterium]
MLQHIHYMVSSIGELPFKAVFHLISLVILCKIEGSLSNIYHHSSVAMKLKLFFVLISGAMLSTSIYAQDKLNIKFGNVSPKDFETKVYSIDSNANAVVLADVGSSTIEGNLKGGFSIAYKRYKRVHILNKNGYDVADVSVHLFSEGEGEEVLDKLKAVTYNLENGKIVESKLDVKANLFKNKLDKYRVEKKFTFPNVKEGSIIEFEYTVISNYLSNLRPWSFQGEYPVMWSEYNLTLPEFLGYVFLTQGYKKYDIHTTEDRIESFRVIDNRGTGSSEQFNFNANVTDHRWVIKKAPALKAENYTSTIENHLAKIEFQLAEIRRPLNYERRMGTWEKLADDLLKREDFGVQITKDNGWLKEIIAPLRKEGESKMSVS